MKTNLLFLFCGSLLVAGLTFAQEKPKEKSSPKPTVPAPAAAVSTKAVSTNDYPVICYLQKNDREIAIKAGPKGTLYSVKTTDGKVLLENVSLEQLRAQAPEIHEFIKTAVAREDGSKKDASIRVNRIDAAVR